MTHEKMYGLLKRSSRQGIGNEQTLRTTGIICIKSLKYLFNNDPDILFHNQVLLIIIACLKYYSRAEDLKRFVSVWSCEKFCSFVFSLFLVKRKALTRRYAFHHAHMVDKIKSGLQN